MKAIVFALVVALGAHACKEVTKPAWQGWVYPNANDLTNDIPMGTFDSLEACRDASTAKLYSLLGSSWQSKGDYECGKNCRPFGGSGLNVCDVTER